MASLVNTDLECVDHVFDKKQSSDFTDTALQMNGQLVSELVDRVRRQRYVHLQVASETKQTYRLTRYRHTGKPDVDTGAKQTCKPSLKAEICPSPGSV